MSPGASRYRAEQERGPASHPAPIESNLGVQCVAHDRPAWLQPGTVGGPGAACFRVPVVPSTSSDPPRGSVGARASIARGRQCGGQAGQQDVEASLEFGGAVVGGQDGGEASEQRELADRQPVQAQAQQVVGLVGVLDEFLQFVEDVAVQEAEQGTVDVQGVRPAEACAGQQRQDVFERAQGALGAEPSGVASGRVTSSGTTCGWASASLR